MIDQFPELNCVEVVQVQIASQKPVSDIPCFLSQCGYALVHSTISHLDATPKDCMFALPRQGAIVRLDFTQFKDVQEKNAPQDGKLDYQVYKNDLTFYQ